MPKLFKTLDDVIDAAWNVIVSTESPASHAAQLELFLFHRALNALKASRLLLDQQHWEFVAPIVRQLYETDLNVEWLQSQPDRDAATFDFVSFGAVQRGLSKAATADYDASTGRPVQEDSLAIRQRLAAAFPRFLTRGSTPEDPRFVPSWCRRNTRELAESSANPMRLPQYMNLYKGAWSEQAHASPVVHIGQMFEDSSREGYITDTVLDDDVELIQCIWLLVTLFLEHWSRLETIPSLDPRKAYDWMSVLREAGEARRSSDTLDGDRRGENG